LQHGIVACDEPGVYVTLEEEAADLYQDMGRYGWDLDQWVREGKLVLLKSPYLSRWELRFPSMRCWMKSTAP
jgi:KaiC/GvpD/RAD55 family RecA-like ATPase